MAQRGTVDTTLIIRARDEASKAVSAIEGALQDLLSTQKQVAAGSQTAATGISQTVTALTGLDKAYSQIAGAADKGVGAFQRQLSALASNQAQLKSLETQLESARAAQERMNAAGAKFVGPPTRDAVTRYAGVTAEVKNLDTQIRGLQRTVTQQEAGFDRSASTLGELARQTKLAGAVTTFAKQESEEYTRTLKQQEAAAERVAQVQAAIARSTNATTGKSAGDSADVFRRAGLTDIEKQIAATERAQDAERDYAAAVRMTEAAMRARARIDGNGAGNAPRAADTAFAQQLREEEDAAQAAARAEKELIDAATKLRAALNPLGVIQENLNRELLEAENLYKRNKISATELAQAQNLLRVNADRAAKSLGQQNVGGGKPTLFGLKPYEVQNLGYQVNDIVTQLASGTSLTQTLAQQGGQILQIFPRAGSAIVAAFSNPAVLAFAATIGAVVLGMNEAGNEAERLRGFMGQLAASADGNSYGAAELNKAAEALDKYGLSAEEAVAAVRVFVKEGVDQSRLEEFGRTAADLAEVMGIDLKDAAKEVGDAFTGGYASVKKLDDAYNFLTATQREHIQTLFEEGKAGAARNLALDIFTGKMNEAAEKSRGPWASAIRELSGAWQEFLNWLSETGPIKGVSTALAQLGRDAAAAIRQIRGVATADDLRKQIEASRSMVGSIEKQIESANGLTRRGLEANLRLYQQQLAAQQAQLKALEGQGASVKEQGDTVARNTEVGRKQSADLARATEEGKKQKTLAEEVAEARRKAAEFVDKEFANADAATKQAYINQKVTEAHEAATKRIADEAKRAADEAERERKERERLAKQTPFISPVDGARVSSGFGLRNAPKAGASTYHKGIDLAVPTGTPVRAPADGVVIQSGYDSKLGKFVYIDHGNNTISKFGHLSDNSNAAKGQIIRQGETFAKSGNTGNSTGAHLHYQVEVGGKPVDPRKGVFASDGPGRFQTDLADAAADYDKELEKQKQKQEEILETVDRTTAKRELDTRQLQEQSGLQGNALLAKQREAAIEDAIAKARQDAEKAGIAADDPGLALRIEKLRQVEGAYFDAAHAKDQFENDRTTVDKPVADLTALRDQLQQQIQFYQERGQTGMANQLEPQLDAVNLKLTEAIEKARAFYTALQGNPTAMAALGLTKEQIDNIKLSLDATAASGQQMGYILGISGQQIAQAFASTAVSAIDKFAQSVAEGENVFKSLGQAFLQFASDFLRQIAQMIMQQIIFNLISGVLKSALGGAGAAPAAGLGNKVVSVLPEGFTVGKLHDGGIVGGAGYGPRSGTTLANPAWFANAARYHTGGIAGLRPNEVPAVLERGEEVLTRDDPRHAGNGGGGAAVKNVILFDPAEAMSAALNTRVGEKALLTFVRANSGAFRSAMGG